jgi:hypothetical protein
MYVFETGRRDPSAQNPALGSTTQKGAGRAIHTLSTTQPAKTRVNETRMGFTLIDLVTEIEMQPPDKTVDLILFSAERGIFFTREQLFILVALLPPATRVRSMILISAKYKR